MARFRSAWPMLLAAGHSTVDSLFCSYACDLSAAGTPCRCKGTAVVSAGAEPALEFNPAVERMDESGDQVYYTCRKCSKTLFCRSQVLHEGTSGHGADGTGVSEVKEAWGRAAQSCGLGLGGKCSSVFLSEPPEWAESWEGNNGRISCPNCRSKVGSFSWSGSPCSCGKWVTPAFQFQIARIDPKGLLSLPVKGEAGACPAAAPRDATKVS